MWELMEDKTDQARRAKTEGEKTEERKDAKGKKERVWKTDN